MTTQTVSSLPVTVSTEEVEISNTDILRVLTVPPPGESAKAEAAHTALWVESSRAGWTPDEEELLATLRAEKDAVYAKLRAERQVST